MLPAAEEKLHNGGTSMRIMAPKSDLWNIILLFVLYTIQSVPKGLSEAIPLVLQSRGASYTEQAAFHLVQAPFIFKLLWAPLVDSMYSARFGKRKSWVIPTQFLMGCILLLLYFKIEDWLGSEDGTSKPKILLLTVAFFSCNLLRATHDIALDGWALTMLQRENIGHAGTTNMVGYTAGCVIGYTVFTAVTSKEFGNTWLRNTPEPTGLVSIPSFLFFWFIIFTAATILLWIFKKDNSMDIMEKNDEIRISPLESFCILKDILMIKPVRSLCIIAVLCRGFFAPSVGVTPLKLIDRGVTRDKLVLATMPLIPFHAVLPFFLKRYLVGPRNMDYFARIVGYWLIIMMFEALFVYVTPLMKTGNGFPWYYYVLLFIVDGLGKTALFATSLSLQAFYARISDPSFGGTYTTFLNTVGNIGKDGSVNAALWLIDIITWRKCTIGDNLPRVLSSKPVQKCPIFVDGYYIEIIACVIIGTLWLNYGGREKVQKLVHVKETEWLVAKRRRKGTEMENLPLAY